MKNTTAFRKYDKENFVYICFETCISISICTKLKTYGWSSSN